jgi:hypothetical protein
MNIEVAPGPARSLQPVKNGHYYHFNEVLFLFFVLETSDSFDASFTNGCFYTHVVSPLEHVTVPGY